MRGAIFERYPSVISYLVTLYEYSLGSCRKVPSAYSTTIRSGEESGSLHLDDIGRFFSMSNGHFLKL